MLSKPISTYLSALLLMLSAALALVNWYLRPGRGLLWFVALLLIGCMAILLLVVSSSPKDRAARSRSGASIQSGILCAAGLLVIALGGKLAAGVGLAGQGNLTWRLAMALLGAFLIFTGNGVPKMLTPLSTTQCDAARVQAFQRFGGWTWVLAGLGLVFAWLLLPVPSAQLLTGLLLPSAMILIGIQWLRLRRSQSRAF